MTEQKSISSALFSLHETLRKLQQQLPCLAESATEVDKIQRRPNELHALGPFNIDEARNEFNAQISSIRDICSQFESEVLEDVMKMGAGADPAFRKHFTHLKEQANLESTVMRVKEMLKMTNEFLDKSQKEKEELKSSIIEKQQLRKIAHSLGLVTYEDAKMDSSPPVTTITLAGEVIVVDIDIDDTGRILETKVTYVSDTLQNLDGGVEKMLIDNLKNSEFNLFKRNLSSLASLAQLNITYRPVDFFILIKNLFDDMKSICNREISIKPDMACILVEGHGIPSLHFNFPGISIAYWMDIDMINQTTWDEVKTAFDNGENPLQLADSHRLLLSFETSIQLIPYLPSTRSSYLISMEETEESIDQEQFKIVTEGASPSFSEPLRFIKPSTTHSDISPIPLRFVFNLEPPLPASDVICQQLLSVTGLTNVNICNKMAAPERISFESSSLSLEEILMLDITKSSVRQQEQQHADDSGQFEWVHRSQETPDQIYHWKNSSSSSAKLITRVPFQHPVQIYNILQCLRRQQMFNTLYKSIINNSNNSVTEAEKDQKSFMLSLNDILAGKTDTDRINIDRTKCKKGATNFLLFLSTESEQNDSKLQIEVVTLDAPNAMHITILPPPSWGAEQFAMIPISIQIPADEPTKPRVILHSPPKLGQSWNPAVFDEAIMTQDLQSSYKIPVLVRSLYQKMSIADTLLINSLKRPLTSKDDEDKNDQHNKYIKMEIDE
ncbi:mediator of RNA polymerase II transcription subunit 1-domain-containing protein [Mycotypha africana]|uniref:mediator of RNA polymerase II transcription subunit 1-domain-containing protein n=1 Tax=Mycotypha africana TaxID=64632 RepID=UPI00230138BE|nr:mediator of RNA polymerase II transcription subunit 1-domain-containing protein [Mycotypha africana]KAI8984722.1 mediator of RNA polymerase II transcription subunit 1-domain-containing protein [Mycotypha africana]